MRGGGGGARNEACRWETDVPVFSKLDRNINEILSGGSGGARGREPEWRMTMCLFV